MLTRDEIAAWPKAELHVHLDGSLRPATMLELEHEHGLDVLPADSVESIERALSGVDDAGSLEGYLAWFRLTIPLLQTADALSRAAFELAEDAACERVTYLEVRYSPILHVQGGLSIEEVNGAVLDGLRAAERALPIRTGLIVCAVRGQPVETSLHLAELAVAHRERGVVAFDLAGPEAGYPARDYLEAFRIALRHGLPVTVHAGESFGPASVRQALFDLGARRLGHGIRVLEDDDLLQHVVDRRIPLEICPTSNVQTRVVESFEAHPIRALADAGVAVTISTDNRLFSRTTVTDELWLAHSRCGLSESQVREAALNGFRHAFLPADARDRLVREAETAIFGAAESIPDP